MAPDVKIDMDFQKQESDVRHELFIKPIDAIDKNDEGFYALCLGVGNKERSQNLCHHVLPGLTLDKTLPTISERQMISLTHTTRTMFKW